MADQVEARLQTLERHAGWLRRSGSLAIVFAMGLLVMGQATPTSPTKVIDAERFILRDPAGKPRAVLFTLPDGSPQLLLLDAKGTPRLSASVFADVPSVAFRDHAGMNRASLGLSPGGSPLLDFRDDSGRSRAVLLVDTKSQGLAFTDGDGRPQAVVSVDQDGSRVVVHDEQGNGRGVLATTKDGPALLLSDPGERPRVAVYARTGGANGLSLVEPNGTTRGQLVLDRDGPRLDLMDLGGRRRAKLHVLSNPDSSVIAVSDASGRQYGALAETPTGVNLVLRDATGRQRLYGP